MITRRTFRRGACWLGLLLGVASLGAIGVSAAGPTALWGDTYHTVSLMRGAIYVEWKREPWSMILTMGQPTHWRWLPKWQETNWVSNGGGISGTPGEFIMPLWIPAALGVLCLYWLLPEQGPRHLCAKCKYDLRGVPKKDGERTCPECGTVA